MGRSGWRESAGWIAVALAVAATSCGHDAPAPRIRLTEPPYESAPEDSNAPREVLRVGIGSTLSPGVTLRHYRDLVDYLGERLGIPTEMVLRPNCAEINELLRQRYCMVGLLCNYAFVRTQREFGAEAIAAPVVNGEPTYRAYVIVGQHSRAASMLDLAGKRFAFADPLCNAGWLYPSYRVVQMGRKPWSFFGAEIFTYGYETSIRAVAEGSVDGAGVEAPLYDALIAAGDPAALRTRIVDRSPPLGTPPVVVHPRIDAALRRRVGDFFLTLHEDDRGREILRHIGVDRFVETDPALYAPIRDMADSVERP